MQLLSNTIQGWNHTQRQEKLIEDFSVARCLQPERKVGFEQLKVEADQAFVVLSDASEWKIADHVQNAIQGILNQWKEGDDIRIKEFRDCYSKQETSELKEEPLVKGRYILKNVREGSGVFVEATERCDDLSKAHFLKQVDHTGYSIITEDGSIWVVGYWDAFKTQYWREGDRVVINKGNNDDRYLDYMIMNMTRDEICNWVTQVFADGIHF